MPGLCAPDCITTIMKTFATIFVIYGVCVVFVYNSRVHGILTPKPSSTTPARAWYTEVHENPKDIKFILQWTGKTPAPFNFMGDGKSAFVKNKCKHTNCFVTDDRNLLPLTEFDAVVFNGRPVLELKSSDMPQERSPKQKYVFGATESSDRFPVCNKMFDSFFNWTWTYKLDSDFRWGYITIYDTEGNKVGPAVNMRWPKKMDPISEDLKEKLSGKTKAAAWFVSHCNTVSKREKFVEKVNSEAKQFGWKVDIYGSCGNHKCPRSNWRECDKMVQNDYFFYFSLENSYAEDYVTEKLLTALNNNAVPVVYGSANYSRFLPKGSYIDGTKLGPKNLVKLMNRLMSNLTEYYDFFRWKKYYNYTQTVGNLDICNICEALNDQQKVETISVWSNFREWWNGARHHHNCP